MSSSESDAPEIEEINETVSPENTKRRESPIRPVVEAVGRTMGALTESIRPRVSSLTQPIRNRAAEIVRNALESDKFKKPFNIGTVKFAPIDIPLARRLQTSAVLFMLSFQILSIVLCFFLIRSSGITLILFLIYVGWIIFFQKFHYTGGMGSQFVRSLPIWKFYRDYFPISLVKSIDLPNDRPYLFGYHPHGIISLGALGNFATEATGFSELFPGINLRLLTLTANFRIPFFSLLIGLLNVCDASKASINHILSQGNGNSVMLVLGGAKEALEARPGNYRLMLKNRKGFVKLALQNGAALVPVFSFGEIDVYKQVLNPQGSRLRKIQDALQSKMGFSIPLIQGRGIFNYDHGLLPYRHAIVTVVGRPIDIPKLENDDITSEIVDQFHQKYIEALTELFDYHKNFYDQPNAVLEIF